MATIQFTTFTFIPPPYPRESEYENLKRSLMKNPKAKISPPSQGFFRTFKFEILYLGTGVLGLFLALMDLAKFLNVIGGIVAFVAFFGLFSFVPSFFSYSIFVLDRRRHYIRIKKDVLSVQNYEEFMELQERRRWKRYK